jgi:tripartite-type tricarboxylate transporter receptor subunit TctC
MDSGKLRELAVTGKNRIAELLNIPKVAEAGVTVFEVNAWLGVFAPSRTPRPNIDRLSGELGEILLTPEVRQRIMQQSMQADGGSLQSLRDFLAIEIQGKLIREVGIRSD